MNDIDINDDLMMILADFMMTFDLWPMAQCIFSVVELRRMT